MGYDMGEIYVVVSSGGPGVLTGGGLTAAGATNFQQLGFRLPPAVCCK